MVPRSLCVLAVCAAVVGACRDTPGTEAATPSCDSVVPADAGAAEAGTDDGTEDIGPRATVVIRNLDHPLLAELVVSADRPVAPVIRIVGAEGGRVLQVPEPAREHVVLVAGLRAERDYVFEVAAFEPGCAAGTRLADIGHRSGPLPADLPEFAVTTRDPAAMAPGLTLFNLLDLRADFASLAAPQPSDLAPSDLAPSDGEPPPAGWIFLVDDEGEVVWFHVEDHPIGDVRMLPDGTVLFEFNDTAARRIDLRGNVLEEWAGTLIVDEFALDSFGRRVVGEDPVVVDTDSMHHEHLPLPDGTRAILSTELIVLDGFDEPLCGEDPAEFDGSYHLVADVVVIFDPIGGEVLERFRLSDLFDPRTDPEALNLCGLPFPFVFPNWLYSGIDPLARDWTHANGIAVDEATGTLIVSIRHLDAVIGLRWKTDDAGPAGELLWHSGPSGDLRLVAGEWHRHQHAPEVQADGTLLLYDNGNNRPGRGTPDAPFASRAVLYDIDPGAGTVTERWQHVSTNGGDVVFAPFVGDADRLTNGNVLITDGGLNGAGPAGLDAQIVEVVPDLDDPSGAGDEIVFRFEVRGEPGWIVYRAERVPAPG